MTAAALRPEPVPLVRDSTGRLMVQGTRISLDILVADFKQGKTPEAIHEAYQVVSLAEVYAVFAYYLRHRDEIELYLAEEERKGVELRKEIETKFPAEGLRAKLLSRLDT